MTALIAKKKNKPIIKIEDSTLERLKKAKIYKHETYDDIINRVLEFYQTHYEEVIKIVNKEKEVMK